MNKLEIEQTSNSPRVILDPENNRFEIYGESRPEDVSKFYMPIMEWFDKNGPAFSEKMNPGEKEQFEFNFNVEYFNSISAKYILDIVKEIGKIHSKGIDFRVNWHYEEDDEDMLEVGVEMSRLVSLPFEYRKIR